MTMKTVALLFLALSMLSLPAAAQSLGPVAHTENGVTYLSGGIGEGGLDSIRAAEPDYNLHLLFAVQGSGFYLSNVRVKLIDAKGATLVDAVSDGPYFLAKLKPGRYKIVAESNGKALTKSVDMPSGHAVSESFYWPYGG